MRIRHIAGIVVKINFKRFRNVAFVGLKAASFRIYATVVLNSVKFLRHFILL